MKKLTRLLLPVITLVLIASGNCAHAADIIKSRGIKYNNLEMGLPYLNVSAGAGAWYVSTQKGLDNRHIPYSISLEYGRTSFPVSIVAGAFFHTTFNYNEFLINPNNLLMGIQFAPLRGKPISDKFNIYAIGGLNLCYSLFTEELYPGIINYEYKVERKTGAGIGAGLGAGYRFGSWAIKPTVFYFTGHAGFLAGHFTEQRFSTASLQFHLMLSYRLVFNKNNRLCPVYKNLYRL